MKRKSVKRKPVNEHPLLICSVDTMTVDEREQLLTVLHENPDYIVCDSHIRFYNVYPGNPVSPVVVNNIIPDKRKKHWWNRS